MEMFGYTIIRTCELRHKRFEEKSKHDAEVEKLKARILELENKVDHQSFQIKEANYAINRAQRDRALTENQYHKICKENRHLEAEIDRLKNKRF